MKTRVSLKYFASYCGLSLGFHESLLDLLLRWCLVICGGGWCWLSDIIAVATVSMLQLRILGTTFCVR